MTLEQLIRDLEKCSTLNDACRIYDSVWALPSEIAFHLLFTLATRDIGTANLNAAILLADVEPPCPVECEVALRILASGRWQVSDHYVPFYLITQFGKARLIEAAERVASELEGHPRQDVLTVRYWARRPAMGLVYPSAFLRTIEWQRRFRQKMADRSTQESSNRSQPTPHC